MKASSLLAALLELPVEIVAADGSMLSSDEVLAPREA
jgi:hypothetical protein